MRTATIFLCGFLVLGGALPARAAGDLSTLNVYPNPARQYRGDTSVTFDNVTKQVRLQIYTVSGHLVRDIAADDSGSKLSWDLTNDDGANVAGGVYVYVVTNDAGEKKTGKLAILR